MNVSEIEMQMYEKYKKNSKTLILTGGFTNTWFWRNGEVSYAQFTRMNRQDKNNHLLYLLSLSEEDRGTNDDYILKFYGPATISKNILFFTLEDEVSEQITSPSTEEDTSIPTDITPVVLDETELIKNIPNLSKQNIRELLEVFYNNTYPKWEMDLFQTKDVETFIKNTNDEYQYSSYFIGLLTTYRTI